MNKSEVIEVTEAASQDRNLQRAEEQTLLDNVEVVKIVPQKQISERMCEQIRVIDVPKNSRQKSVEVVKSIPQEGISERMRAQSDVIDVTKISSQDRSLLRTVDRMLDLTKISGQDQSWQRTLEQLRKWLQ